MPREVGRKDIRMAERVYNGISVGVPPKTTVYSHETAQLPTVRQFQAGLFPSFSGCAGSQEQCVALALEGWGEICKVDAASLGGPPTVESTH